MELPELPPHLDKAYPSYCSGRDSERWPRHWLWRPNSRLILRHLAQLTGVTRSYYSYACFFIQTEALAFCCSLGRFVWMLP